MKKRSKKRKRPQRPKQKQKKTKHTYFPINEMSDGHYAYGDKDGGYDNWIPYRDYDLDVDKSNYLNTGSGKELMPKQGQRKNKENRYD